MENIVLIFEEAYSKKGEDHFGLFRISGELLSETSNDPLSIQAALTLLYLVPEDWLFGLTFQLKSATLTVVSKISILSTGLYTQDDTTLDEPEVIVHNVRELPTLLS